MRPEVAADRAAVGDVVAAAFGRADEAELVERLRDACPDAVSLVAVVEDEIVGHVMMTPVHVGTVAGAALAPLAVRPSRQRCGIGAALVRAGLAAAGSGGAAFVVVLGDPAYYGRFGFAPAAPAGLLCPFPGVPDAAWQALPLKPAALAGVPGAVRYARPFSE